MAKYPYDVFISYSRSDLEIAEAICDELKSKGFKYWIDKKIPGGEDFDEEIIEGLEQSNIVILIFSKNSLESPHVTTEIANAFEMNKPIISYRVEDVEPEGEMKYYLANKNWLDSFPDYKTNFETLVNDAKRLIEENQGPGFLSKYKIPIVIAVVLILLAIVSLMVFNGNDTIDTSTDNSTNTDIVIDYIGMDDDTGNGYSWKYSYFVYGSIPSQLSNSSKDVVHVDFYDDSGKIIHSNDTKIKDIDDNILGYAYLNKDNVEKVTVELHDSKGKVISRAESTNIK